MSVYLFDMNGVPIAFRRTWTDPHLFDLHGHWVGWFPWEDNDAVDVEGTYLGTVVDDRLVRRNDWQDRPCTMKPTPLESVEATGHPLKPHYFPNGFAYEDARIRHHA